MKKLIIAGLLLVAGAASAREYSDYARVISSTPMYEEVNTPKRECWTEYRDVPQRQTRGSDNNIGGAIVGGVVGGLLGNQVGGGNGRTVATAGGAIAGAIIGSRVQTTGSNDDYQEPARRPVERCKTSNHLERRLSGYDVRYEYKGQSYQTVLPNDPGQQLPVNVRMEVTPRM
ncbi:Uncharacterized conserved protein YcfJ, contains glycine zipper 2TM domain [Formivibrio citricus]|uniref:Uncharacterized conserved protein YcfJ, contains glycine zipper 2TM domain n=1 Tax=Formivibrio citricus TaxID=83765 RepID=A0A1I5B5C9_9NEIS|nr:glycine zipper 2TM domain-containing protein [Formivibrio citricus]SFN69709.1 Uncharacterized conserved protein YcfJ, contains glycine zipper 2TM domain [Formivibrio citricus]